MAYTVDWVGKIIYIPEADLTWIVDNIFDLALSDFHKEVRGLEWDEGLWAPQILDHTSPKLLSGVTYAAFDEIINDYMVQFVGTIDAVRLKGSNNNIVDVYIFNGISVVPSNSAGLQDLNTLLAAAYIGEVNIHLTSGQTGTSVPIGTRSRPSNNWADTEIIAHNNGLRDVRILESITMDATAIFNDGHNFIGDNPRTVTLTVDAAAAVPNCLFTNLTITGTLDANNVLERCNGSNLVAGVASFYDCALYGLVTLTSVGKLFMAKCFGDSLAAVLGETLIIDLGGTGSLRVGCYTGGITLQNYAGSVDGVSLYVSGKVIVDASCTGGTISIAGDCIVTDNSGVGCTVNNLTSVKSIQDVPDNSAVTVWNHTQ